MTSSNGNFFHVTGHLCEEFTAHRWIPLTKRPVTRSVDVSLIWAWINGWVNNHEAGDLKSHRTHYDVTVMVKSYPYAPSLIANFVGQHGTHLGRQDPGGPHVVPKNFAIWDIHTSVFLAKQSSFTNTNTVIGLEFSGQLHRSVTGAWFPKILLETTQTRHFKVVLFFMLIQLKKVWLDTTSL